MAKPEVSFGLYLGNTTCCIAVNERGSVKVPHDSDGFHNVPAIVAMTDGDEIKCGRGAKQDLPKYSKQSIIGVLRDIASSEELGNLESNSNCSPSINSLGEVSYCFKENNAKKSITASNVLVKIFGKLKDIAKDYSKADFPATLCLPAWVSSPPAVTMCVEAAHEAGFRLLSVIFQPSAASLAYNLLSRPGPELVLTLHYGDTTGLASLVGLSGGVACVKDSTLVTIPPGKTLTQLLTKNLAEMFQRKFKLDINESRKSQQKLFLEAEKAKHALSAIESNADRHITCESLHEGIDFDTRISRCRFELIIYNKLQEFLQPPLEMLQKNGINPADIKDVILSGGTCKIPKFLSKIKDAFPNAQIHNSISADEVLAIGAALESQSFLKSRTVLTSKQNGVAPENQNGGGGNQSNGKGKKKKAGKENKATPNNQPGKKKNKKKSVVITTRDHQPSLLSVLSTPIWCLINDRVVPLLDKNTPPLTRITSNVTLSTETNGTHDLTVFEAEEPLAQPESDAVLMKISLPASEKLTELNIICQIKTDGRVELTIQDPVSKKSKRVLLSPDDNTSTSS